MSLWLLLSPFLLQLIVMGIDESLFHYKRGLPKWERIGHPLDTLSFIIAILVPLFFPFSIALLKTYIALALFSCLMVTKDEFIHKHYSSAAENWFHAVLFILHPIVLGTIGYIWWALSQDRLPTWFLMQPNTLHIALSIEFGLSVLFFLYQIIFWNFIWIRHEKNHQQRFL